MKILATAVIGAGLALSASMVSANDTVTVMNVERAAFSKAPFKRQFKTLSVTDVAAADTVVSEETVTIIKVSAGANRKAPFRRQQTEVAVTDIAAMELQSDRSVKRYNPSRKPPYRH